MTNSADEDEDAENEELVVVGVDSEAEEERSDFVHEGADVAGIGDVDEANTYTKEGFKCLIEIMSDLPLGCHLEEGTCIRYH